MGVLGDVEGNFKNGDTTAFHFITWMNLIWILTELLRVRGCLVCTGFWGTWRQGWVSHYHRHHACFQRNRPRERESSGVGGALEKWASCWVSGDYSVRLWLPRAREYTDHGIREIEKEVPVGNPNHTWVTWMQQWLILRLCFSPQYRWDFTVLWNICNSSMVLNIFVGARVVPPFTK